MKTLSPGERELPTWPRLAGDFMSVTPQRELTMRQPVMTASWPMELREMPDPPFMGLASWWLSTSRARETVSFCGPMPLMP